jgi:hypothetical protein
MKEMTRTLIGVISYAGDAENGNHDAIRDTWGKDVKAAGADLRFFIGRRSQRFIPKADEVCIDWQQTRPCNHPFYENVDGCCEDFWQVLTKNVLRWSIQREYDFTFLCENDVFIVPHKLMACGFEKYDLTGHFDPIGTPIGQKTTYDIYGHRVYPWPDASGYFVSKKAAEIIIQTQPDHWFIGMYAGQALGPAIERGELTATEPLGFWQNSSWHYRVEKSAGYPVNSGWQQEMYEKYGRSK